MKDDVQPLSQYQNTSMLPLFLTTGTENRNDVPVLLAYHTYESTLPTCSVLLITSINYPSTTFHSFDLLDQSIQVTRNLLRITGPPVPRRSRGLQLHPLQRAPFQEIRRSWGRLRD